MDEARVFARKGLLVRFVRLELSLLLLGPTERVRRFGCVVGFFFCLKEMAHMGRFETWE